MDDKLLANGEMSFTIYYGNVGKEPAQGFVAQQEINSVVVPVTPYQSCMMFFLEAPSKTFAEKPMPATGLAWLIHLVWETIVTPCSPKPKLLNFLILKKS
jgi:hypothetical protein